MVKTSGVKKLISYLQKAGSVGGIPFVDSTPSVKAPFLMKSALKKAPKAKKTLSNATKASPTTPVTAKKQTSSKATKEQKRKMPVYIFGANGKPVDEPVGMEGGRFMFPYAITVDGVNGNVIVADSSNDRIQVLKKEGNALSVASVFGSGEQAAGWESPGKFNGPCGVAVDKNGNLLVIDSLNDRVQVFGADGGIIRIFGSEGHGPGQFCEPYGVAVDEAGDIFIADRYNHHVSVFSETGTFKHNLGHFKGSGAGQFQEPCGVAVDGSGNIIVVDTGNHRLQTMTKCGKLVRIIGAHGAGAGQFESPWGVAIDKKSGHILVADSGNHRVQVLTGDGSFVTSFGSEGEAKGEFRCPRGVAVDDDHVFVLDTNNKRVQVFARTY